MPRIAILLVMLAAPIAGCLGGSDEPLAEHEGPPVVYVPADDEQPRIEEPINESSSGTGSAAPPERPQTPAPPAAPLPRTDLKIFPGSIVTGIGASAQGVSPHVAIGDGDAATFEATEGLRGVVAELAWSATAGDLDLFLYGPGYSALDPFGATAQGASWANVAGDPVSPDNPARIVATDVEGLVGTWRFEVAAKAAAQADFTLYVTLFYNQTLPEGYSALASS